MKKSLLIATLGYPGSGKTYFSERLAKEFNLFHLNSDKIRLEMFDNPTYKPPEHRAVFRFIDWLTEELLLKGVSVIVDANTNKRAHRHKFRQFAEKAKALYILIFINTPLEVAEKRLIERRKVTDKEKKKYYRPIELSVLHRMKKEVEYPKEDEPVLVINGLEPYSDQVKVFIKRLKDLQG